MCPSMMMTIIIFYFTIIRWLTKASVSNTALLCTPSGQLAWHASLTLHFTLLQFKHNRRLEIPYLKSDATPCIWHVVSRKKWREMNGGTLGALMDEKAHSKRNWLPNQKRDRMGLVCNYKC